jgi:hypothetical protein
VQRRRAPEGSTYLGGEADITNVKRSLEALLATDISTDAWNLIKVVNTVLKEIVIFYFTFHVKLSQF